MASHTVLIGYGGTGRAALASLNLGHQALGLIVVDVDPDRVEQAAAEGANPVLGDGCSLDTLLASGVRSACSVVVAVGDDARALQITSLVRGITEEAMIVTVVSERRLCELSVYLGADRVVVADHIVGGLADDVDLAVAERLVREDEVGRSPAECGPSVLALVREGRRIWRDDAGAGPLGVNDRLLVLHASTRDPWQWSS